MTEAKNSLMLIVARGMIVFSVLVLLLFLANLRSRLWYHGPDYSFLFAIFAYCLAVGVGLLKRKKWAVLLLFLPGVFLMLIFIVAFTRGARVPMPWALVNYAFLITLFIIPAVLLRTWRNLSW